MPSTRTPGAIIAVHTARAAVRSAAVWGCVFGVYVAASALGYASTYPTAAERSRLAATFGSNLAITAIIGPAHHIDTVAGFTAWRSLGVLSLAGAVWGLLLGTRLLRGEEDAGRWEHLLSGQTTRGRATGQAVIGLACGLAVLWLIPAASNVLLGRSAKVGFGTGPALFLALALVSSAAVFLAAGALSSQLAPTRRQAAAYAGGALGVAYALRMAADSGIGLEWLRWLTPLGWVEELRPLTDPQALPLIPIVAAVLGMSVVTIMLAGSRDLGAATFPDRAQADESTFLLGGATRLALRLSRPVALGWITATALAGIMLGLIAKSAGQAIEQSSSVHDIVKQLGVSGLGAQAYLGVAFLIVGTVVAMVAAGQVGATRAEEGAGRLDHLLVQPLSRTSWLSGRLAVAGLLVVLVSLVAGLSTWAAAATQGSGIGLGTMVGASLNLLPPAVLVLGVGTLALGAWPRACAAAAYGVVAWSFLIELIGGLVNANHWVLDTSILHHMALAPAVPPNWRTNTIVLAVGLLACVAGGYGFAHRDLAGD